MPGSALLDALFETVLMVVGEETRREFEKQQVQVS